MVLIPSEKDDFSNSSAFLGHTSLPDFYKIYNKSSSGNLVYINSDHWLSNQYLDSSPSTSFNVSSLEPSYSSPVLPFSNFSVVLQQSHQIVRTSKPQQLNNTSTVTNKVLSKIIEGYLYEKSSKGNDRLLSKSSNQSQEERTSKAYNSKLIPKEDRLSSSTQELNTNNQISSGQIKQSSRPTKVTTLSQTDTKSTSHSFEHAEPNSLLETKGLDSVYTAPSLSSRLFSNSSSQQALNNKLSGINSTWGILSDNEYFFVRQNTTTTKPVIKPASNYSTSLVSPSEPSSSLLITPFSSESQAYTSEDVTGNSIENDFSNLMNEPSDDDIIYTQSTYEASKDINNVQEGVQDKHHIVHNFPKLGVDSIKKDVEYAPISKVTITPTFGKVFRNEKSFHSDFSATSTEEQARKVSSLFGESPSNIWSNFAYDWESFGIY